MELIAGLYKKDTGEIFIYSVDQSNFTEFAKNIGTIIETPMFPDNLSGLDTLKYYSKLRRVNADLEGLLKMTGILSQKDKKDNKLVEHEVAIKIKHEGLSEKRPILLIKFAKWQQFLRICAFFEAIIVLSKDICRSDTSHAW